MDKKTIKVGVIGGLGPLASASFVETIYIAYLNNEIWQQHHYAPNVYLYSEPLQSQSNPVMSVRQSEAELLAKLEKNTASLMNHEMDCIVLCCFTAHVLLPKLLTQHQVKIYSLITLVLEYVLEKKDNFVVLSASSAREAHVLETHPLWSKAGHQIIFIDNETQKKLDLLIQAVKKNQVDSQVLDKFLELMSQFPASQFIIACAELHILHKKLQSYSKTQTAAVFDPFFYITQKIWGESE